MEKTVKVINLRKKGSSLEYWLQKSPQERLDQQHSRNGRLSDQFSCH